MKIQIMKYYSGKFVLKCQIFNQDSFQKYLKIKMLQKFKRWKICSLYIVEGYNFIM